VNDLAGSVVLAPPPGEEVAAAQALADGHVVAVLSSGTVVELAPAGGGLVVESTFVPQTGIPSEPSALEVLQGESGMQVLVTDAGGDQVFDFIIPGSAGTFPTDEITTFSGWRRESVEVTPLPGGPLTVVVTLTTVTGTAGRGRHAGRGSGGRGGRGDDGRRCGCRGCDGWG